ncbi:dna polymerase delta subunit [Ophiostoma piceae UAMH 11346]|uniref:Dna polymerase delta subunit n=1 Tax=Ophiostoma piceae (strain UAMH 11346) TaxID=1262450 RepID=S3D2Q1_OPHP1|nr:dna polymerase delta subunit [Ophiostoma piceae UAMH 11346]
MPPRKVSGGRQATLSFNHRVTKAVPKQSAKEAVLLSKKTDTDEKKIGKIEKIEKATEKEAAEAVKAEKQAEETKADDEPLAEDVQQSKAPRVVLSPLEIEADSISDSQIRRYWRSIEAQSLSRPVHQEGMGLGEKVLRHFDVSSQFGPCVGIERKKRWMRAQRLGLAPPIEVLAVMLHEEAEGVENVERSSFDAILNASVAA